MLQEISKEICNKYRPELIIIWMEHLGRVYLQITQILT